MTLAFIGGSGWHVRLDVARADVARILDGGHGHMDELGLVGAARLAAQWKGRKERGRWQLTTRSHL